jgi:hypothetical protein
MEKTPVKWEFLNEFFVSKKIRHLGNFFWRFFVVILALLVPNVNGNGTVVSEI